MTGPDIHSRGIFRYLGLKTYAGVAAPLFFVIDLLTPVANDVIGGSIGGNVASWLFAAIGLIGVVLPRKVCRRVEPSVTETQLTAFRQFSAAVLATGVLWVLLSVSSLSAQTGKQGVIATLFPQVEIFQTRLFGSLEDIQSALDETREGVGTLVTYAEEDRADPNVQLAKRGIQRTEVEFLRALKRADVETVTLFVQGGWPVKADRLELLTNGGIDFGSGGKNWSPEIAKLFLDHRRQLDTKICRPTFTFLYKEGGPDPEWVSDQERVYGDYFERLARNPDAIRFLQELCGAGAYKTYLEGFAESEEAREASNNKGVEVYRAAMKACVEKRQAELQADNLYLSRNLIRQQCKSSADSKARKFFDLPDTRNFAPELRALLARL